jgi:hypothetical protein
MTGTLHEDHYTFLIISRAVLFRMRNVSYKMCRENQNTWFMCFFFFFFRKSCPYEMWKKSTLEPIRPQMTIWRMRNACWITKATNTHSEYVILISFPPQQWLHESASVLRYTYIACHVISTGSGNFLAASNLCRTTIEQSRHAFHNLSVISF